VPSAHSNISHTPTEDLGPKSVLVAGIQGVLGYDSASNPFLCSMIPVFTAGRDGPDSEDDPMSRLRTALFFAMAAHAAPSSRRPGYVDPNHSQVGFTIRHLVSRVAAISAPTARRSRRPG
jgi:hypothetical protein